METFSAFILVVGLLAAAPAFADYDPYNPCIAANSYSSCQLKLLQKQEQEKADRMIEKWAEESGAKARAFSQLPFHDPYDTETLDNADAGLIPHSH